MLMRPRPKPVAGHVEAVREAVKEGCRNTDYYRTDGKQRLPHSKPKWWREADVFGRYGLMSRVNKLIKAAYKN